MKILRWIGVIVVLVCIATFVRADEKNELNLELALMQSRMERCQVESQLYQKRSLEIRARLQAIQEEEKKAEAEAKDKKSKKKK
jgi:hypothetical protein